jgi:predicted ester cyclase
MENVTMTSERNKAIVRRFYDALVAYDLSTLNEVLAPDFVAHSYGAPGPQSRELHLQGIGVWSAAFETDYTIQDQIAEGDKVATRVTMHAIHNRGDFQGLPPTSKKFDIGGLTIERIKDGKIVERWVYSDRLAVLQQHGIIPTPKPA